MTGQTDSADPPEPDSQVSPSSPTRPSSLPFAAGFCAYPITFYQQFNLGYYDVKTLQWSAPI